MIEFLAILLVTNSINWSFCSEKSSFYSSCDFFPKNNWTRSSGVAIKSWISSIVPYAKQRNNSKAYFGLTDKRILIRRIYNSKIFWKSAGIRYSDGWFYSKNTERNKKYGSYYIYPNFKIALYGEFDKRNQMDWGKPVKITHYKCNTGIMELKFTAPNKNSPIYKYSERTNRFVTNNLTLMDPLDTFNAYIGPSKILKNLKLNDSVFAKRDIPYGEVILTYNGRLEDLSIEINFANITTEEADLRMAFAIEFNDTHMLDIDPPLSSLIKYRASLGHKVNHHFKRTNTVFGLHFNPRFGLSRSVTAIKTIRKGEELFVNYGYDIEDDDYPHWYQVLYKKTYGLPNA